MIMEDSMLGLQHTNCGCKKSARCPICQDHHTTHECPYLNQRRSQFCHRCRDFIPYQYRCFVTWVIDPFQPKICISNRDLISLTLPSESARALRILSEDRYSGSGSLVCFPAFGMVFRLTWLWLGFVCCPMDRCFAWVKPQNSYAPFLKSMI